MQSCQSTCMDSISVKEMEMLPSLNSEIGEVIPKLIKSELSMITADTDKRNKECNQVIDSIQEEAQETFVDNSESLTLTKNNNL